MKEPLQPGDRVCSDDSKQWSGVVTSVSHGQVSVRLDTAFEFPAMMSLDVGGLERDWLKLD